MTSPTNSTIDPHAAERDARLAAVIELAAPAVIAPGTAVRAAVGDVELAAAMTAAEQAGEQRFAAPHRSAAHEALAVGVLADQALDSSRTRPDGVYDPRHPNDRLLLGMKGTMSEMELSLFRQRSLEALKQKARRGELFLTVAVGYLQGAPRPHREGSRTGACRRRSRSSSPSSPSCRRFGRFTSGCATERLPLPAVGYGPEGRSVTWKLPVYNTLHHMLTNPIYAGAYAFGRTGSRVTIEAGRKRDRARLPQGSQRLGGFDPRPPRGLH